MPSKTLPLFTIAALLACAGGPAGAQQVQELTFWSQWAAKMPKRTFVEEAIKQFEAKNPGIKLKQTWYEKTALTPASRRRCGPGRHRIFSTPNRIRSSTWKT